MKTAYATIKGIEVMHALRKGQASAFYYGGPPGEVRLVNRASVCNLTLSEKLRPATLFATAPLMV